MPVSEHRMTLPSRYRVLRHIADGGMASVWAAHDNLLDRLVAVKVLSPAYAADERANRRFLREARAGARLSDCRHVVTVYDIGEHDGRPFMVMEHFAGGSIADRVRSDRAIPRALALRWLREAAEALDCAHRHDVVHRDVKPANLLIDERGRLAVGDFGIATVASEASITQTGQVLGTAAYISPEQARGETATAASDRYALAVVAFELLTGRKPFAADHPTAQARAHVEAPVPAASAGTGLPPAVDRVLRFGMAKDPERRPSTATDFLDRLEEALEGEAAVAPEPPTTAVAPPPQPVATRRRWPGLAALAALALVAGSAIAIATGAGKGGGGGGGGSTTATHQAAANSQRPAAKPKPKPARPKAATATQQTTTQQTSPPSTANADPVALNNQGFALIQQGNPTAAIPSLQRSVQAFREQGRTGQIDYAYALYNLGNALRLTGRPSDAIPYLEERLRISNFKRGVVKQELKTAQRMAKQG